MPSLKPIGDTWLIQRLSKPKGYKNPFGDVSVGVEDYASSVSIEDVFTPDYMGAAEYEWGVFPKCLGTMQMMGAEGRNYSIHNKGIYVVMAKGCDVDEIKSIINYLYFKPSLELHNTGRLPEISKSDYSSFYRAMSHCLVNDYKSVRTHGWLNVSKYFAWFIDKDMALAFEQYCNTVKMETEKI